jgi:hypothetical protein
MASTRAPHQGTKEVPDNEPLGDAMTNRRTRRGHSASTDAAQAVAELARRIGGPDLQAMVFFCSPSYDLDVLGACIEKHFSCPTIGCTTAGEIFSPLGYLKNSLVGIGFVSLDISMETVFIPSLTDFVGGFSCSLFPSGSRPGSKKKMALMLVDGLSMLEERVASAVQSCLQGIPLVGGSAGDNFDFGRTHVYHQGRFHQNAAVIAVFETTLFLKTFRVQHFMPTDTKLVITEADSENRSVSEINGLPAADEYARIVGLSRDELSPRIFAAHPLMVRIGGEYFVRSIREVHDDGSLSFFCAIDNGLVLTLARSVDLLDNLSRTLEAISNEMHELDLVLACDCILRRIDVQNRLEFERFKNIISDFPFIGFSTYGEQFNGIHVNQTLTGFVLGKDHD